MPDPRDADLESQLEMWAAYQPDAELSLETRKRIGAKLKSSLPTVKPLPSHRTLVLMFLAVFVACSAGLMAVMDKAGFRLMTGFQMAWMAAALTGGAVLCSLALTWRMVPGTRPAFPVSFVLALSGVGVIGGMALLFPWKASRAFVSEGWPCAATELMIAVPATFLFWLLARQGALFASAGLGAVLTGLAVFLALMTLQFQCMFQQAPHLLVWHVGTAATLIGAGSLIGKLRRCA